MENYIPKDLDDCLQQLDKLIPDSEKEKIKKMDEEEFSMSAHFVLGQWIRNQWILVSDSRLAKYFADLGVIHSDDMSVIIIISNCRYLQGRDINLQ